MLLNFAILTLCLAVGTLGRTMYVKHQLPHYYISIHSLALKLQKPLQITLFIPRPNTS